MYEELIFHIDEMKNSKEGTTCSKMYNLYIQILKDNNFEELSGIKENDEIYFVNNFDPKEEKFILGTFFFGGKIKFTPEKQYSGPYIYTICIQMRGKESKQEKFMYIKQKDSYGKVSKQYKKSSELDGLTSMTIFDLNKNILLKNLINLSRKERTKINNTIKSIMLKFDSENSTEENSSS